MIEKAGINKDEKSSQNFAYKINIKNQFYQICKAAFNPKIAQEL